MEPRIMMPVLFFLLTIVALGTILYVYLREEQNKIIPKNYYDEAAKSSTTIKIKPKKSYTQSINAYLRLIVLSATSGLLIWSFQYIVLLFLQTGLGAVVILSILQCVQLFLVIPATFVVYKIDSWMLGNINPLLRAGIPLIFNVLFIIVPLLSDLNYKYNNRDVTVTIKNETFFLREPDNPSFKNAHYEVVLHVNNPTQREISDVTFFLVTYKNEDEQHIEGVINNFLGNSHERYIFPVEESEIVIDVSIWVDKYYQECTDGSLEKPLYLMYSIGETFKPLEVGNNINKKILQNLCPTQ